MSLFVLLSSLVGTVALLLGVNVIAYACGAVGLFDTLKKIALGKESDKFLWMLILAVYNLASRPDFSWWQALMVVFLIKTLIMAIVFFIEILNRKIEQSENEIIFLKTIVTFDFFMVIIAIIGSVLIFFDIYIVSYIAGVFVLINILFQVAEGTKSSLVYLWISIMIGISIVRFNAPTPPWFLYTLSSLCIIRTITIIWRAMMYLLFRDKSILEEG